MEAERACTEFTEVPRAIIPKCNETHTPITNTINPSAWH